MDRKDLLLSLTRLRKGLLRILGVVIALGILIYPFSKTLLRYLQRNLQEDLVAFAIPEAFLSMLKLTLYASIFLSIPVIFYQVWKAFSPMFGLRGAKSTLLILLAAIFLFYLGSFFCYFVTLPFGIRFLVSFRSATVQPMISVGRYVSFCVAFIFAFGLIFELPLILALLSYARIIQASLLTRNRRYAILFIAVISAVLTPTPDAFNMAMMGGPLYILFEVGIVLVKGIERRRKRL